MGLPFFLPVYEREEVMWVFTYELNAVQYQEKEFESRGEGLLYAEREFPAFIRAPNENWQELRSTGSVSLEGGGFLSLLPK